MTTSTYDHRYPSEAIGGGNPYRRCASCKRSDPEINGKVEHHYEHCKWRQMRLAPVDFQTFDFTVNWSYADQVYVARAKQRPSMAAHGNTPSAALRELELALQA